MQSTPCPATAHPTPKTAERAAGDATPPGTVAANPMAPHSERAPPSVSLCDQLLTLANMPANATGAPGADDLDKLLAANDCGR